jgi:hypothetical protein
MAPAYYFHEASPWWMVPIGMNLYFLTTCCHPLTGFTVVAGTTGPFFLVHFFARPFVSWIYLTLPLQARQCPRAALEYSRNLPRDISLQIFFMRATALTSHVEVSLSDLVPSAGLWPPTTFKWVGARVNKGSFLRPNPTRFFVNMKSGTGKAARDTVPGIWENVYRRITSIESSSPSKWSR